MRSLSWLQRCWRSAAVWLRRVPVRDPVDRRNAPALQLLLLYLGLEIPLNKLYILLNARLQMTTVQLAVDLGTDAAIALAAWYGIWRIRQGAVKPAIGMFITVVLCSAVIANVAFGYQLQAFDPFPLLLLTLAALVIGGARCGASMRASPWCFCWAWPARGDAIRRTGAARSRICRRWR